MEEHLIRALNKPTDKLAQNWKTDAAITELVDAVGNDGKQKNSTVDIIYAMLQSLKVRAKHSHKYFTSILPSGRFRDDYLYSGKFITSLDTIGFSVNPEHCRGVRWSVVLAAAPSPNTHLVLYHRTNVVKMAVSSDLGKRVKTKCGASNLRAGQACSWNNDNGTSAHVDWSAFEFCRKVTYWYGRQAAFFKAVSIIRGNGTLARKVHGFTYEELQKDFDASGQAVLQRLRSITSPSIVPQDLAPGEGVQQDLVAGGGHTQSGWVKRSSEDLSSVLVHLRDPSCAVLRAQLTSIIPEEFPRNLIKIKGCSPKEQLPTQRWKCTVTPLSVPFSVDGE